MSHEELRDNGAEKKPENDERPTWIKVHVKHLIPETLNAYNLPWEWDQENREIIIIKTWFDEDFQEELFAHTKRILEGKHPPAAGINDEDQSILQGHLSSTNLGYIPPVCAESNEPLSFDINLRTSTDGRSVNELPVNSSRREHTGQRIDIASSCMPGFGKVILYRAEEAANDEEPQFSWIHMETEPRNMDDFLRFASDVPKLAHEDRALVLSLQNRVRSRHWGWDDCNDVMRCIGLNSRDSEKMTGEKFAILLSFPYYTIQKMKEPAQYRHGSDKHPRSLLQYFYKLESTRKRDLEQTIRKLESFQPDNIIHVSHIWAVIVNFRYIITSTPMPLIDAQSSSLEITSPPVSKASSPASIICVIDPLRRVFFFPMEQCKTYFAIRFNVMMHCLPAKVKNRGYDFQLLSAENTVIKAEDWAKATASQSSTIFRVYVQILSPARPKKITAHLEHADTVRVQRAKGVERKETVEDEKALVIYAQPTYNAEKWDTVRPSKLQRHPVPHSSGLVVNQKPSESPLTSTDFCFEPTIPDPTRENGLGNRTGPNADNGEAIPEKAESLEEEVRPIGRAATFQSLLGGSPDSQPSSRDNKLEVTVDLPPVFDWPVGRRQDNPGQGSSNTPKAGSSNEITESSSKRAETIKDVLSHIDKELLKPDDRSDWEIYAKASKKTYFDVIKVIQQQWPASPNLIATGGQNDGLSSLPPWETALREVVACSCRLFNFFITLPYPCAVAEKFWGAMNDLITIIPQMCDKSRMLELTKRTRWDRMPEAFFVADLRRPENADLRDEQDQEMLVQGITECLNCDKIQQQYPTKSDALDHLFVDHFQTSPKERPTLSSQSWWVMDLGHYLTFLCRKAGQRILHELHDYLTSLERMAYQIQHGVSGDFDKDKYRIPPSLVNAFQDIVMMVVTGAHIVKGAYRTREAWFDPYPVSSFLIRSELNRLAYFGRMAEIEMESAIRTITLMTYTDEALEVVTYEAVSPSLVLALIIGDTYPCWGAETRRVDLVEIYRDYILDLQFKASQNPHRRLLQEIYLVQEELQMIYTISNEQRLILVNYTNVLHPSSFRTTTESRVSSFEFEKRQLNKVIIQIEADLAVIRRLSERLDSLATQTRNSVDVKQEEHGKAIMAFAIVTVVFMPLSFMTSYFGMNVTDIRDTGSSQALFWAISLPFTVFMIVVTLFVAFNMEQIREAFDALLGYGYRTMRNVVRTVPRERSMDKDVEKPSGSSTGVNWWGKKWSSRRRRTSLDSNHEV